MSEAPKYAARVYFQENGTILIKQTVLKNGRYVVDCDDGGRHREDFASQVDGQADRILQILNAAREGRLQSQGSAV